MDEPDIRDLARLHMGCLSDSNVAALGASYVRSFYRYIGRSEKEIMVVARDGAGRIVAAAVISLEPAGLTGRLLLHTSLLLNIVTHARRMLRMAWAAITQPRETANILPPPALPELILIYTSPEARGQGLASALIEQAEDRLHEAHVTRYQVKTVADPANPALAFYRDRRFTSAGTIVELGRRFEVFTRSLDAAGS